jgi:hypothetical protein
MHQVVVAALQQHQRLLAFSCHMVDSTFTHTIDQHLDVLGYHGIVGGMEMEYSHRRMKS